MEVIKITGNNFKQEVKEAKMPVLVDFWASWCGPCKMQGPVMNEIAEDYDGIKVGKVNVDEEQALAMEYGVSSIPTLILFREGNPVQKLVGLHSKEQLAQALGL